MPAFSTITIDHDPGQPRIARLTLNRPDHYNAINEAMPGEIRAAIDWAQATEAVHVVIVEGAGKGFCGGYDLGAYYTVAKGMVAGLEWWDLKGKESNNKVQTIWSTLYVTF